MVAGKLVRNGRRPLVSTRVEDWSLLEEPHGGEGEPVPISGNAEGLEAWGSGLNKAWRRSPHESRCLYLRGGEGGCQRNACDLRVGIKTSRRLGGKVAGGLCRSWEHRSWGGGYGGPLSLPYCYCSPPDPRWLQTTMETTHTGAT